MTQRVRDIMNSSLLYVREGDRTTAVLSQILRFGVTGVPVLDDGHRPVGFISLRDIAGHDAPVSSPVFTVRAEETVESAARQLAESTFHRAVVVDGDGVAVGMVSSVDFLRALTGVAARRVERLDAVAQG